MELEEKLYFVDELIDGMILERDAAVNVLTAAELIVVAVMQPIGKL